MSEVKRYEATTEWGEALMSEYAFGDYVAYEDYAALKAKCDALAALTAQPVKLPSKSDVKMGGDAKTRSLLTGMNMMRKSCADAIRAAGYQVEGE